MAMKNYYDKSHMRKWLNPGGFVYLKLGHGYNIKANQGLLKKLARNLMGKVKVLERVGHTAMNTPSISFL
ncbi:uncharacterized protein N7500_008307 [Penicillium coprophilum]|uniref:uncharacterized protein n=1 Tax=Penicillium coprophilum TaxID=36646 RepID=UPI002387F9C3|nr:uncharacterized protein N7500_008307 [Penicillium coprophilum]KAJ5158656.1 hypothetical protein N7500_008307 [Penicillium coprophilum]